MMELTHTQTTALITGASSGIGYELAKIFAQNGHNLILVARNEQTLNQLADESGHTNSIGQIAGR